MIYYLKLHHYIPMRRIQCIIVLSALMETSHVIRTAVNRYYTVLFILLAPKYTLTTPFSCLDSHDINSNFFPLYFYENALHPTIRNSSNRLFL